MATNPLAAPCKESHHCLGEIGGLASFLDNRVPSRALNLELDTFTLN